jgi:hypothetical protein
MSTSIAASGSVTYDPGTNPTDGKKLTIGSVVYTFRTAAPAVVGDVKIVAGHAASTLRNLANSINGQGGAPGVDYFNGGSHYSVLASHDPFAGLLVVTARTPGTAGNAIVFTSDESSFTLSGAGTLSGGIDGESYIFPWSILGLEETKSALRVRGDSADVELAEIINATTDIVERFLEFRPVADLGLNAPEDDIVEFHDLANPQGFIYSRRRPIRSVTKLMLRDTQMPNDAFVVDNFSGMVSLAGSSASPQRRILGGYLAGPSGVAAPIGPFVSWPEDIWRYQGRYVPQGTSSAILYYKGGWANTYTVDPGLKAVAIDIAARIYRQRERKSQGVASEIAQGFALATKYEPKVVTEDVQSRLRPYKTHTWTARR